MQEIHHFTWQGIDITLVYKPHYIKGVIAHLEIHSVKPKRAPLPITSTGYKSYFHEPGTIEALGGDLVGQVVAWLDEEAAQPAWQEHLQVTRQGSLF